VTNIFHFKANLLDVEIKLLLLNDPTNLDLFGLVINRLLKSKLISMIF